MHDFFQSRLFNIPFSLLELGVAWTGLYAIHQFYQESVPWYVTGLAFIVNGYYLTPDFATRFFFNVPLHRFDRHYERCHAEEREKGN
jgi:hypothetical protein